MELVSTRSTADRTAEILHLLETEGVCRLGAGDFYVKNLVMPDRSCLTGCGNATRVILDGSVTDGFAIRLQSFCTLRDFELCGSTEPIELCETVGTRHGILWQGNYKDDDTAFPQRSFVDGLYIHGFSGGGITHHNTGYCIESGITAANCWIWNCNAGVNIDYWSEFNRYTNVHSFRNYYGAVNNGGNNVFVNCCFSGNTLGMLMDNSRKQSPNNSHGSIIGCIFDHTDHNKGVGIRMLGMKNGEMFTGCQVFYSRIELADCDGIVFTAGDYGREVYIDVKGGGTVLFSDSIFQPAPVITVSDNANVKFVDCYDRATGTPVGLN